MMMISTVARETPTEFWLTPLHKVHNERLGWVGVVEGVAKVPPAMKTPYYIGRQNSTVNLFGALWKHEISPLLWLHNY